MGQASKVLTLQKNTVTGYTKQTIGIDYNRLYQTITRILRIGYNYCYHRQINKVYIACINKEYNNSTRYSLYIIILYHH